MDALTGNVTLREIYSISDRVIVEDIGPNDVLAVDFKGDLPDRWVDFGLFQWVGDDKYRMVFIGGGPSGTTSDAVPLVERKLHYCRGVGHGISPFHVSIAEAFEKLKTWFDFK